MSHCVKSYGHLCQFYQNHSDFENVYQNHSDFENVYQNHSDFENVYFLANSILNFGKSYQIWGKWAQEQKSYRQKRNWGWKHPPSLIGLNVTDLCS